MPQFVIGQFDFINLSRPPSVPQQKLVRETKPGKDGVTFFQNGKRAEPFQLTSSRDCATVDDAASLVASYQDLVGQGAVSMWWCSRYRGDVVVHGVEPIDGEVRAVLLGIGGILGTSRAMARCVWLLEYVAVQQQQQ